MTSTEGYEFYVGWLINGEGKLTPLSEDLKLSINVSTREANVIKVEYANGGSQTYNVGANSTRVIEIDPNNAYVDQGTDETENVLPKGVRVYSDNGKPFTLFAVNKIGATKDGTASFDVTQVVPVEGLGKEYIIHTHNTDRYANQFMIVGTEDGTEIDITLSAASKKHTTAGPIDRFTLDAKNVYLVTAKDPNTDFSGTTICASKPVAVFTGNLSVLIPGTGGMTDDHAYEQSLPIDKWGKHFVVPMTAANLSANMLEILAQTATHVSISGVTSTTGKDLAAGETWRVELNTTNCPSGVVYVESAQPILTYLFTTSSGRNPYTDPSSVYHVLGDPSSTLIPPVEHFTDTTIFVTYKNPDETAQLSYYLNLWAKTSALSSIKLDNTKVTDVATFVSANDPEGLYSFARFEITEGTHYITAPSKVFTGYTYGISDGEASLYTVGYEFITAKDSLFVNDQDKLGNLVTARHGEYIAADHRWHLEKNKDVNGKEFNDSIYICDSTTLTFPVKLESAYQKVVWKIASEARPDYFSVEQTTASPLEHQFLLLPTGETEHREPFEDFELQCLVYRSGQICGNLDPDTLSATVRVLREYNDTTWMIVCRKDTTFFYDNYNHGGTGSKKKTKFKYGVADDPYNDILGYTDGKNSWTRHYTTVSGCDSTVTLMLFGCQPTFIHIDTTVCQKDLAAFTIKDIINGSEVTRFSLNTFVNDIKGRSQLIADGIAPYDITKKDIRASHRHCASDADYAKFLAHYPASYKGCPDTMEVTLTVMPFVNNPDPTSSVTQKEWCTKSTTETFPWYRADGTTKIMDIEQNDPRFDANGVGHFGKLFTHTACTHCAESPCPQEYDTLILHIAQDVDSVKHICQNEVYEHNYGGTPAIKITYNGADYKNKLYPAKAVEHTEHIQIGTGSDACEYDSKLTLYVHPAWPDTTQRDTTCIAKSAADHYAWANHEGHKKVWQISPEKKKVDPANISTQEAGTYEFIDSLQTSTCTECANHYCDSIWHLTLLVAPEKHFVDSSGLCRNKVLEYDWKGTKYYYYGAGYDGDKKGVAHSRLLGDDLLNSDCNGPIIFDTVFEGKTQHGCDSTRTLKIHLNPTIVTTKDTSICISQTYNFLGKDTVFTEAKTHVLSDIIQTECGCDNGVTHTVHVYPVWNIEEAADTTCQWLKDGPKDVYIWAGHADSTITMRNIATNSIRTVKANEIPLDQAGTFTLTGAYKTKTCPTCSGTDGKGCDSIHIKSLTIVPTYKYTKEYTLSDKATMEWKDPLGGSDNILFVGPKATVPSGYDSWKKVTPKPGQGECDTTRHLFTTKDSLKHSVGTHTGCDSIVTYHITFGETYYFVEYDAVCENCSYTWTHHKDENCNTHPIVRDGQTKTITFSSVPAAGVVSDDHTYQDIYQTTLGFDSTYVLILEGFPAKTDYTDYAAICQGGTYDWAGHPGQPAHHNKLYLVNPNGTTTEIENNNYPFLTDGVYTIVDSMLTDTTFFDQGCNETRRVQCDSIWTLTLTVHPTYNYRFHKSEVTEDGGLCSNETLLWEGRLFVGYDYDETANPLEPASSSTPYDSIVRIPSSAGALFYDSVERVEKTQFGCDSFRYINIHISKQAHTKLWHHIGDNDTKWYFGGSGGSFKHDGKARITREDLVPTSSVDYGDSLRHEVKEYFFIDTINVNGCDSIVWDSLWIHPSYRFVLDTLLCSNNTWDWRKYPHINESPSGTYYDSLKILPYNIDSIYVLELTIQPGAKHYFGDNICKNDTIIWDTEKIYYRDYYDKIEHRYSTGSQCDSILIFTPVFYEYYHFSEDRDEHLSLIDGYESDSICQYDTLIWISPGETKPHTAALRGEKGEKFAYVPTDTIQLDANGNSVGFWMTVYDSLHTTAPCHCDSTYKLRYFVKPSYRYYDTITICSSDTAEWRGMKIFSPTAAQIDTSDVFQTRGGSCDSIYYLTLYINQAYDSVRYDTICGNIGTFEWEGHNLDAWLAEHENDTEPIDTFLLTKYPTEHLDYKGPACDSVFQLYLNVRPILTTEWNDTICIGETYTLNDKTFTTTGVYTDTLTNRWGCDTFAVVHLEVVPATVFTIEPLTACADAGTYDLAFTFDTVKGFAPRAIQIVYDSLAQANGFPDDTVNLVVDGNMVEVDLPGYGLEYVKPNNYSAKVYFDNGTCVDPELQRVDIRLTIDYPSWITEQHWSDAIGILAAKYNGGYTFSAYQWYKDGEKLVGKTDPYLFEPDYLEVGAEYQVLLTREGDTISFFTCPIIATKRDSSLTPQKPYVSVVPTYVVKENPVVHILSSQHGGEFKLYSPYGALIESGRFEPGPHNAQEVKLPAMSGVYLFELIQEEGERRTVKVLVN